METNVYEIEIYCRNMDEKDAFKEACNQMRHSLYEGGIEKLLQGKKAKSKKDFIIGDNNKILVLGEEWAKRSVRLINTLNDICAKYVHSYEEF